MDERLSPVDRETLYEQVWAEPIVEVAKKYGMSDVGLLKTCRRMSIPVPGRGYWAKVRAGKIMHKVPLPPLRPERAPFRGPTPLTEAAREHHETAKAAAAQAREQRKQAIGAAKPLPAPAEVAPDTPSAPPQSSPLHPLIKAAKARLSQSAGWEAPSGLRAAPKEVFDLQVTKTALERGLQLADRLVRALESQGFSFTIDSERGRTVAEQHGTQLPFQIVEKVTRSNHVNTPEEDRKLKAYYASFGKGRALPNPNLPRFDYHSQGRLTVSVGGYGGRNWNDTLRTSLDDRIDEIVLGVVTFAADQRAKEAERRRRQAQYEQAESRYEALILRRNIEAERLRELRRNAARFRRAEILRDYIAAFETHAGKDGPLSQRDQEWIEWARAKADWIDPFVQVSDLILDAPVPRRPSPWDPSSW